MADFIDQTGRKITLDKYLQRIISLVPSQTELLAELGLDKETIGITKFCVHPDNWFRSKIKVGGTKQIKMDIIHQLQPDLIIANKEENVKEQVEELGKNYPVWISDVNNLEDAYEMIGQIGEFTNREEKASTINKKIKDNFSNSAEITHKPKTIYLIWQKPYMTIGGDTFINAMMGCAGFKNIYADKTRYPEITIEEIKNKNPELLFLSSEPFPFKQKHIDELKTYLPNTKIILVDGELFSWYGSRLQYSPCYFSNLREKIK